MTGILQSLLGSVSSAVAVVTDAYFNLVTLLLPGNGTNGAQNNTFLDSSSNNFTITRNGNTTQGTFSPFSQTGWSNYFNSANTDYLTLPYNSTNLGSNDFTLEAWVYISNYSNIYTIFNSQTNASTASGSSYGFNIQQTTGYVQAIWYLGSGFAELMGTTGVPLNAWNHIAFARTGGTMSLYVNGVRQATRSDQGTNVINDGSASFFPSIGRNGSFYPMNGHISNLRIIIGSGGYNATNSSITVPTSPLTSTTNTVLLTCNSNRFVDTNTQVAAKAITVNGAPSVQAFSPFAPTAAYSAATVGGSGYFDGTGDYLTVADNAALEPVGNNFCIEALYYPTSVTGNRVLIGKRVNPGTDYGFIIYLTGTSVLIYISSANSSWDISNGVNIGTLVNNQWHHIAVFRVGNAWYGSFNGAITTLAASNSSSVNNNTGVWGIGADSTGGTVVQGYISNVRFVIGSSVYSSTSAPFPTAPLTAITNTQLLLNYTNAGITDATSDNVIETVGNAQISTAQSKFGGSSMYFDGTGDQLVMQASENFEFYAGNFTVECWVYITGSSGSIINYSNGQTANSNFCWEIYQSSSTVVQATIVEGSTVYSASSSSFSLNAWNHIAAVRNGNTLTIYVNGTAGGTTANVTNVIISKRGSTTLKVSGYNNATGMVTGYIDDLRITKGFARYTANFTAPTAAFPLQ